ncbi:hypothetical protein SDC9_210681 [bioreactor metagenome]|uniref:Uncharacterized protein n=1 Tax=bioreactor metagenome TaxID=1076179 RepID=A0A645JGV0_9ZZZZ
MLYGRGNNKEDNSEGAKYKNVLYTNALGPVLVKNPWLTSKLIETALNNKGERAETVLDNASFDLERKSAECIKAFIRKKQK